MKYLSTAAVFGATVYAVTRLYGDGQTMSSGGRAALVACIILIGAAICFSIIGHAEKKG